MEITKIKASPKLKRKLRVCAYCRVSVDKETMHDSLASQISHYNELIGKNPEWEFAGIYADEAYTGTKNERPDFQKMMDQCRKGMIDLILVKSVSRFARNALTALEYTRELRKLNIDVFFESENLHSNTADGEMILSLAASFAQAESKSVSDNMKWKVKRDFQQGISWGANHLYGYDVKDKKFIVNEPEAEMIRKIFNWYLDGAGFMAISKRLTKEGYRTASGGYFVKSQISCILANEIYTGDLLLQKSYVEDYLTKRHKRNKGEFDMYLVENDHEAIISKETFELVKKIRARKAENIHSSFSKAPKFPFTGMIVCGKCGKGYRHKVSKYGNYWSCNTFEDLGKEFCSSKKIPEKVLYKLINELLGTEEFDEALFKKTIKQIKVVDDRKLEFIFYDETSKVVEWDYESRSKSWTPEMKKKASETTKKIARKRGEDGKWQQ